MINAEKLQEEALQRENSQLKSFLYEQNSTSSGLTNLHNKLETHIQRLQRHTEDLRRDIHTSPPALLQRSPRRSSLSPRRPLSPMQAELRRAASQERLYPSPKLAGSSFLLGPPMGSARDMSA